MSKNLFFSVLLFSFFESSAKDSLLDSLAKDLIIAKAETNYEKLKNIYGCYRLYYEAEQDYKNAYGFTLLYQQAMDSLLSQEKSNEIENSQNNKLTETTESSLNKIQTGYILLFIGVLFLIIYLSFIRTQQIKKHNAFKKLLEEQGNRARSLIEADEKERTRLVHELNEGIGQQISAARLNISALQSFVKTNTNAEKLMMKNAVEMLDESVKEVRHVTQKMLPNVLVKAGLIEALKAYTSKINSEKTIIYFESHGSFGRMNAAKESVLYRVVIELITNALQHAEAKNIDVQVICYEREMSIVVQDNGRGFEVSKIMKDYQSHSLRSIQSRIDFLNGVIFFDSCPTKGTTVTIEIPSVQHTVLRA